MTTYTWGSLGLVNPARTRRALINQHARMQSPFTGSVQTAHRWSLWQYILEWDNVSGTARAELVAALERLDGLTHRLELPEFNHTQRGVLDGTPVVDGSGQTGEIIAIRGAGLSVTNWARAGDWLSWDNLAHTVVADADSDGAGDVTVEIRPRIRTSPTDATAVDVAATLTSTYMLTELTEIGSHDILASGDPVAPSVVAVFLEDVLA